MTIRLAINLRSMRLPLCACGLLLASILAAGCFDHTTNEADAELIDASIVEDASRDAEVETIDATVLPCPHGYSGTNGACTDIDECLTDNGGCDARTTCANTPGGRVCSECPSGYEGAGETTCEDIDECLSANGGCDMLTICTNTMGGRTCGACPDGYTGVGTATCVDINECSAMNGGCDTLTACTNTPGGRVCGACPSGHSGTGDTECQDERTVVDVASGREWQRDAARKTLNWADAVQYCGALVLAGKDDWRLPTRMESLSMADYEHEPHPLLPYVSSSSFWSATEAATAPTTSAWAVGFSGRTGLFMKTTITHVRCVRGPTLSIPANHLVVDGDTVVDTATGLVWQRTIDARHVAFDAAAAQCSALSLQGGGWRLPTIRELLTIVDEGHSSPAIDPVAFPNTPTIFIWSSTPYAGWSSPKPQYWRVLFGGGQASYHTAPVAVRCVR